MLLLLNGLKSLPITRVIPDDADGSRTLPGGVRRPQFRAQATFASRRLPGRRRATAAPSRPKGKTAWCQLGAGSQAAVGPLLRTAVRAQLRNAGAERGKRLGVRILTA